MSQKLTTEDFIERSRKVHGDKYDYSKVVYSSNNTKVCIICPVHGEFWQLPSSHWYGNGCNKCRVIATTENFVSRAREIHGDRYDYSKSAYKGNKCKVTIICPTHGEFTQNAGDHLSGKGCRLCGYECVVKKNSSTTSEFIESAKSIHGDRYDYSCLMYVNNHEKVPIVCKKHGVFRQAPNNHLAGQGCPLCYHSKGEDAIMSVLDRLCVKYEYQYKINDSQHRFRVDFFLPDSNIIIEFNGIQHYQEVGVFHRDHSDFDNQLRRDKSLADYCKNNNIKLIIIKYDDINNIYNILKGKLLKPNGNENN